MLSYWKEKRPVNKVEAWIISWAVLFFCLIGVSKGTLELHWTDNRSCPTCLFHHSWDCTTTFRGGRRGNLLLSTWRSQRLEMWVDAFCGFFLCPPFQCCYMEIVFCWETSYSRAGDHTLSLCSLTLSFSLAVILASPLLSNAVCWHVEAEQLPTNGTKGNWCKSPNAFVFFSNMKWGVTSLNLLCWCCRWKNMLWLRNLYSLRTLSPQLWSGLQR